MSKKLVYFVGIRHPTSQIKVNDSNGVITQVISGYLFEDKELTKPVGNFISQYTIVPFKNKYYQNGLSTYYLPKGTITIINANKNFIKKSDGTYVLPFDKSFLNSIASGTENYLNSKGSLFRSKVIEKINFPEN